MSAAKPCPVCGHTEDGAALRHGVLFRYLVAMVAFALGLGFCIDLGSDYFGLGMAFTLALFFAFLPFMLELLTVRKDRSYEDEDYFEDHS